MLDILAITIPIYLVIAIGFGITRAGMFAPADMRVFGKFVIQLALPALLFNALSQRSVAEILNVRYMAAYALAGLLVMAGGLVWTRMVQRRSMSLSSVMTMGMMCPNSGFVGYPMLLLTLGGSTAGVCLALNMIVENLLLIPMLLALADLDTDGKGNWHQALKQTLKGLTRNPMIIAIVAGFTASLLEIRLPEPLSRTVNLFAQASGALSLLVIGGSLVGLRLQGMASVVVQIGVGKLVLHPIVVLGVLYFAIPMTDPALHTALLLSCAMPIFGIYTILAQRHGHEGISSAALLATTLVSFFTLSGLLWVVR